MAVYLFSGVQRDIEEVEKYSQEQAIKRLLKALRQSDDRGWLDTFKHALAEERNVFMRFPLLDSLQLMNKWPTRILDNTR